jgi:uncharacterized protein
MEAKRMPRYHRKTSIFTSLALASVLLGCAKPVASENNAMSSSNDSKPATVAKGDKNQEERRIGALEAVLSTGDELAALLRYPAKDYFDDAKTAELAEAAKNGDIERVNALVTAGANPNAKGLGGFTPLMYSMSGKTTRGFQRLLELGGDPNLQTESGRSAISFAASRPESESLKIALAQGGNPNLVSRPAPPISASLRTPIYATVLSQRPENARILIKAGADVNARDSKGVTPLIHAAMVNSYDVMYVLLEAGADIRAKDDAGFPVSYEIINSSNNPIFPPTKAMEKCMQFMRKNGIDFDKEKIQNEEILRQNGKKHENDWKNGISGK